MLEQVKLADEFGFDQVWAVEHPFLKNILTARRPRRIQLCNPVGAFVNEQVSTVNFLFCHEDDAEGSRIGRHMATTFNYLASQLVSAREAFLSRSYQSLGLLPQLRRQAVGPDSQGEGAEGLALGNPERILRAVKRWESVGVDRINFLLNCMEEIPQEQVLKSLRLFAREGMPHFQHTDTSAPTPVGSVV